MAATKLCSDICPGIAARGLAVARGGRILFRNLDFTVSPGRVLHVRGGNGAGKTSLLRTLAGGLAPAAGDVSGLWSGRAAFMPADDLLWSGTETVVEALSFWWRLGGGGSVPEALSALDLTGLRGRAVRALSAGQKRRLSLARVLLLGRPLWLLDEPFNSLDATATVRAAAVMAAHLVGGGGLVLAQHEDLPPALAPLAGLCDVAAGA